MCSVKAKIRINVWRKANISEHHRNQLTSSEIACIWTGYMNDSMSKCVLGYFLKDVEDQDIRSIVKLAYDLSSTHIEKLTAFFQKEQLPLPTRFTAEDVNMNAPRSVIFRFIYASLY